MEQIKEAIEGFYNDYRPHKTEQYPVEANENKCFKSELLHLLSLVAKNAFIEGTDADQDELYSPAFKNYWKQFTDNLK